MSDLYGNDKEALKIHYFLLNEGFEFIDGSGELNKDSTMFNITPPQYIKNNLKIYFHYIFRTFRVFNCDKLVLDIDKRKKIIDNDTQDYSLFDVGEIVLDDMLPFFRDEKIKDLFKDV